MYEYGLDMLSLLVMLNGVNTLSVKIEKMALSSIN